MLEREDIVKNGTDGCICLVIKNVVFGLCSTPKATLQLGIFGYPPILYCVVIGGKNQTIHYLLFFKSVVNGCKIKTKYYAFC